MKSSNKSKALSMLVVAVLGLGISLLFSGWMRWYELGLSVLFAAVSVYYMLRWHKEVR